MEQIKYNNNLQVRIDKFLFEKLEKISRNKIQNYIKENYILVNNKPIKPNYKLNFNDTITLNLPKEQELNIEPENIKLNIVYEDEYILIVDKPIGMITHPAGKIVSGTLVNAILGYLKNSNINRYGLVHRLDKDTSGIIMFAKDDNTQTLLSNMFKERKIQKTYYALCEGKIEVEKGIINYPIKRDKVNRKKMTINIQGRPSLTYFQVIEKNEKVSFIKVQPKTGRTHQIRVHCKSISHPIVGDIIYGYKKHKNKYRLMLHAYSIEFIHPITKKNIYIKTNFPENYRQVLEEFEIKIIEQ